MTVFPTSPYNRVELFTEGGKTVVRKLRLNALASCGWSRDSVHLRVMANEDKKDFNAMLHRQQDLPRVMEIRDEAGVRKWGGRTLVVAPPIEYDRLMRTVPKGKLVTTAELRARIASDHGVEVCCPLTCGIFVQIAAWASHQRSEDITPYWRTLKSGGELNPKYPGGCEEQRRRLEAEGHMVVERGRTRKKYFVVDFEKDLFEL